MTIFAVVATDNRSCMKSAVAEHFCASQVLEVGDCLWLIDAECPTGKELTMQLRGGSDTTRLNSFIVLPVNSYFGMHNKLVWEWLGSKGL